MNKRKVTQAMRVKYWGENAGEKIARVHPGVKGYQAEKKRLENKSGGGQS